MVPGWATWFPVIKIPKRSVLTSMWASSSELILTSRLISKKDGPNVSLQDLKLHA